MVGVDDYLGSADLTLLLTIHQGLLLHLLIWRLLNCHLHYLSLSFCRWPWDFILALRNWLSTWLLLFLLGVALLLLKSNTIVIENDMFLWWSVVWRLDLRLTASFILDFLITLSTSPNCTWWRVCHSHHFSIVMLYLNFFKTLIRNGALGWRIAPLVCARTCCWLLL
jgi:hypothetical protein